MSFDNPNFTIITSGGCNSHCDFCTDSFTRKAAPDYIPNLMKVLSSSIPAHFRQVSISGGEPTLSKDLDSILRLVKMSNHFDKVVLTTNGAALPQHVNLLKETIHHLNVSRHAIGYEANTKVFGTRDIITDEALKAAAFELNKAGIDVNINHVYKPGSNLTVDYVLKFIDYARSLGATSASFRYDQNENSLAPTYLEELFSEWAIINSGGCPVCRNHTVLVGGFPVVFKASFAEPSKAIDDVYELVYHITGKLTTDWEGLREFTPEMAARYVDAYSKDPYKQHAVVTHTVAAPNNPPKGQRRVAKAAVTVTAPAIASAKAISRKTIPIVSGSGGGCGFGGGCGGSSSAPAPTPTPAPRPVKKAQASTPAPQATKRQRAVATVDSYGGGCGFGGFGGGCGS
jgi:organic radical activating enzyme